MYSLSELSTVITKPGTQMNLVIWDWEKDINTIEQL